MEPTILKFENLVLIQNLLGFWDVSVADLGEGTVPLMLARCLVVEIHGKCSMGCYGVSLKTNTF